MLGGMTPEFRPLKPKQRNFVHNIVYSGLSKEEAFAEAHNEVLTEDNRKNLRDRASRLFYQPHVNSYYHACMEEIRDKDVKKGIWTKEVSTDKLLRLIERAEEDIYDNNKQLTMSRLNAILLPVKELNLMNGLNQNNVNFEGCIVQIRGEDNIPE